MIEKITKVSNPLTIIALFCGLAEISGTIILPFLKADLQEKYIWFLLFFPVLLILLFFATLNFNPKVLYGPSDFSDENNFLKFFNISSSADKINKLKSEIISDEKIENHLLIDKNKYDDTTKEHKYSRSLATTYLLAEELILNKLSKDYNFNIQRGGTFINGNNKLVVDGTAIKGNDIYIIEVKYIKNENTRSIGLEQFIHYSTYFQNTIPKNKFEKIHFVLAIATDVTKNKFEIIKRNVDSLLKKYNSTIETRIYYLPELEKEFGLI